MESNNDSTARLRWRCRRGTREMDLLLLRFLEQDYPRLSARDRALFGALLEEADPDLYAWITGQAQPANPDYQPLIEKINVSSHLPRLHDNSDRAAVSDTNWPASDENPVIPATDWPVSDEYPIIPDKDWPVSDDHSVLPDRPAPACSKPVECPVSGDRDVNENGTNS